jgi:hypothetical protein
VKAATRTTVTSATGNGVFDRGQTCFVRDELAGVGFHGVLTAWGSVKMTWRFPLGAARSLAPLRSAVNSVRQRRDGGADSATQCRERGNNRYRNESAGHGVLNRGETFFVSQETHDFLFHVYYYL